MRGRILTNPIGLRRSL